MYMEVELPSFHLVPAALFGETVPLCWPAWCSHAALLHCISCAWRQLLDPLLDWYVCVSHPNEWSWKEGAGKLQEWDNNCCHCYSPPVHMSLGLSQTIQNITSKAVLTEHRALWNCLIELCPVSAIARLFFTLFHIVNHLWLNFAPDFCTASYSKYSYQEWYDHHIFARKEDFKGTRSYNSELASSPISIWIWCQMQIT